MSDRVNRLCGCSVRLKPDVVDIRLTPDATYGLVRKRHRLDAVAVDERAEPELEVQKHPEPIPPVGAASLVIAHERVHGGDVDEAALARALGVRL
jgi:hypothetical protein